MPRPPKDGVVLTPMEIRITPPDGQPITDWMLDMPISGVPRVHFEKLLAAQEGGSDGVRLHYHVYLETWRSRSWIIKWIYTIARCNNGESGNTVFFSRKPHDNTIGYVVKHGNIVVRHGCSQTFITDWLAKSEQYRKDVGADRKRKQRIEKAFTQVVRDTVSTTIKETSSLRNPTDVMKLVLAQYHEHNKMYPSRSSMESLIVTLLAPYDDYLVRAFYLKAFEYRM